MTTHLNVVCSHQNFNDIHARFVLIITS